MLLRAIIIDDEPKNRKLLKAIIDEFLPTITVQGESNTVEEGIKLARSLHPHIVFLDIRISEEDDGFKFFDAFKQPLPFEVIFVTAHEIYLKRAINQTFAAGYILKPVDANELVQVIYKVKQKILTHNTVFNTEVSTEKYIDILYAYIKNQVIKLKLADGKERVAKQARLEELEFVPYFFRINRQYIINLNFVNTFIDIDNEGKKTRNGTITLLNGEQFVIAYSRKTAFIKAFEKNNHQY